LIEVGAGGGSIASVDTLGLLQVGPRSAGAQPGPACYGGGGTDACVTDADLVLGYLSADSFLGGNMVLDEEAARAALERLAGGLGVEPMTAAWGIWELVNENMANAARVHVIEHGHDPTALTMVAFGGAGPVHAADVAERLGVKQVLYPLSAGVASAFGLVVAPQRVDLVRSNVRALDEETCRWLDETLDALAEEAAGMLGAPPDVHYASADMRFAGQGYDVPVPLPPSPLRPERIEAAFRDAYTARLGAHMPALGIELVSVRLAAEQRSSFLPDLAGMDGSYDPRTGRRRIYDGRAKAWRDWSVAGLPALAAGQKLPGPCVIPLDDSTIVVPDGWEIALEPGIGVLARRVLDDD